LPQTNSINRLTITRLKHSRQGNYVWMFIASQCTYKLEEHVTLAYFAITSTISILHYILWYTSLVDLINATLDTTHVNDNIDTIICDKAKHACPMHWKLSSPAVLFCVAPGSPWLVSMMWSS
jgi:hypothetical protein